MPDDPAAVPEAACPDCGTVVAPGFLACPTCRRLTHGAELKSLAAEAERASNEGDLSAALAAWREALSLLPADSRQHQTVQKRLEELSRKVEAGPQPTRKKDAGGAKGAAGLGALGLLLWKLKTLLLLLATKGKLLLLGLTKASTFLSMFLSFGVYWTAWGWKFALGLVVSIYVHEMGHVATLRRYGIPASAPLFIPGFGALVRLKQAPRTPREDARCGLAGPLWGLGAALVAFAVFLATGAAIWGGIARCGAWINLFNLLPVWQLDGSRGFRSLSRGQRWVVALTFGALWFLTAEGLLVLIALAALFRAMERDTVAEADRMGLLQFVFLAVALSALCAWLGPIGGGP